MTSRASNKVGTWQEKKKSCVDIMLLAYVTRMIYWKASTGQNTNKGEFSSQSAVYKFVEYQ